jgi:protein SCO1/2
MFRVCIRWSVIAIGVLPLAVTLACVSRPPEPRHFELRGQILAIRSDNELLVKHEDIKGFMPAMTMPYNVRDPQLLRGKAPGDLIEATLAVGDTDAWLTRIEKTGTAPLPDVASPAPEGGVSFLRPDDPAPDARLTSETGEPLSLSNWQGSAVAVTFIYTRCPLPQYCPLMDRRFAEVQKAVKADATLADRVHLLSVSFDPDADTPAVLGAHAKKLGADPRVWRFATAPRDTIDRFASAFGVNVVREADKTITHNLRTAVLDTNGRLLAVYDGTTWTADTIVADLRGALAR